mgnify:CR=1 FL=1
MSVVIITDMARLDELIRKCVGKPVRILHDGVNYGIYQEFGTRYMAAHPFMTPALVAVAEPLAQGFKQMANLEDADRFVEKVARDAEGIAKANAPVRTGALRNSIAVHRPEEMGLPGDE